jgi:hypothetical protein
MIRRFLVILVSEDSLQFLKKSQSNLRHILSLNEIVFIGVNWTQLASNRVKQRFFKKIKYIQEPQKNYKYFGNMKDCQLLMNLFCSMALDKTK